MSPPRPPARWVAPTLLFFSALFILGALDELFTGEADTVGFKSVPRHMAHPATEPSRFYFIVGWNLLLGVILLSMARQQWRLRRAVLEATKDQSA